MHMKRQGIGDYEKKVTNRIKKNENKSIETKVVAIIVIRKFNVRK